MTRKKHKVLPTELLDAYKYEVALELGVLTGDGKEKEDSTNDSPKNSDPLEIRDGLIGDEDESPCIPHS